MEDPETYFIIFGKKVTKPPLVMALQMAWGIALLVVAPTNYAMQLLGRRGLLRRTPGGALVMDFSGSLRKIRR